MASWLGKNDQSWRVGISPTSFWGAFSGSRPIFGDFETEKIGRLLTLNLEMSCAIKLCVFLAMYGQKYASTNVNF